MRMVIILKDGPTQDLGIVKRRFFSFDDAHQTLQSLIESLDHRLFQFAIHVILMNATFFAILGKVSIKKFLALIRLSEERRALTFDDLTEATQDGWHGVVGNDCGVSQTAKRVHLVNMNRLP